MRSILAIGTIAVGAVLLANACTLVSSADTIQCESDADCSGFDGATCVDSVCVESGGSGISTSTGSTTGGTGTGGEGGSLAEGCTSNKACSDAQGQLPYACVEQGAQCVSLLSEDCEIIHGDYASDNALFIGVMATLSGDFAEDGTVVANGIQLVAEEFGKVVGIPGGADGTRRPVVFIVCDEAVDATRAAKHLIEDVKVPAILGLRSDQDATSVALELAVPNDVLLLTTSETDSFESLQDDGLVWQINPRSSFQANPLARLSETLEPLYRERHSMAEQDAIRIAIIAEDDEFGGPVADRLFEVGTFNGGLSGADNFEAGNLRRYDYSPELDNYSEVVAGLLDFEPNFVFLLGDPDVYAQILSPLEDGWTGERLPIYIAAEKLLGPGLQQEFVGTDASRNTRLFGIERGIPEDPSNYNSLQIRYTGKFPGLNYIPISAADIYDAGYVIAYAAVGAGNVPKLDGPALAVGITKVVEESPEINVGPSKINNAFAALTAGGINLNGASTLLDFDIENGTNTRDFKLVCHAGGTEITASGIYYDSDTDSLVGAFSCPIESP